MATNINTLKQWFKNGLKPSQEQFWAWMDSYWHKEEKIPVAVIEGINEILQGKADTETVNTLYQWLNGLIADGLESSPDKTYSINKIRELINIASNIYIPAIDGGLELTNDNEFGIKEGGVTETMLADEVKEKINIEGEDPYQAYTDSVNIN
jgi:hypothetical protein